MSNATKIAMLADATIALTVIRGSKLNYEKLIRFTYLLLSIFIPNYQIQFKVNEWHLNFMIFSFEILSH